MSQSESDYDNVSYSFSYTKNFKKRGHNLKINFSWSDNTSDSNNLYEETNYNTSRVINQRSTQTSDRYDQSIRLDYVYPFNKEMGKIEFGYKRDYDKMKSDFFAEQLSPSS